VKKTVEMQASFTDADAEVTALERKILPCEPSSHPVPPSLGFHGYLLRKGGRSLFRCRRPPVSGWLQPLFDSTASTFELLLRREVDCGSDSTEKIVHLLDEAGWRLETEEMGEDDIHHR
jgi:hypothetical protein